VISHDFILSLLPLIFFIWFILSVSLIWCSKVQGVFHDQFL
jgi:hypothetical protein